MILTHTLIIGGSAAGLASAACLHKEGIDFIVLEKCAQVATRWRNHYDRLHLHTSKKWSGLPFKNFADSIPKYPSRDQVITYLENYAQELAIDPVFDTEVLAIQKDGGHWIIKTNKEVYESSFVIIASGLNNKPIIPDFKGIDTFNGDVLHSSAYKNGLRFKGRHVLVVGFGNSACEQAICLHENGAHPALSVRSPVNVLPRDLLGFPILEIGKLTSFLPAKVADKINAPLIRMLVGDITKLGLKKSTLGPRQQIEQQKRIPLLDIGTMKLIRQGFIKVYGAIDQIKNNTVFFEDGRQQEFDAIILATGYTHNLQHFLGDNVNRFADLEKPIGKQTSFGREGLYFCGFYLSPMGMLHEIGIEARKIAKDIAGKRVKI